MELIIKVPDSGCWTIYKIENNSITIKIKDI